MIKIFHLGAIRLPLVLTILFFLINLVLAVVPVIQNVKMTLISLVFLASGIGIYFLLVRPKQLPGVFDTVNGI